MENNKRVYSSFPYHSEIDEDSTIFGINHKRDSAVSFCSHESLIKSSQEHMPIEVKAEDLRCDSDDRSLISNLSAVKRDIK